MGKFTLDPDHTVAQFCVRHMMVTLVRGMFNKIKGRLYFDPDDMAASSIEAEVEVARWLRRT